MLSVAGFFASLGAFPLGRGVYSEVRKAPFLPERPLFFNIPNRTVNGTDADAVLRVCTVRYTACTGGRLPTHGTQGGIYTPGYTSLHGTGGIQGGRIPTLVYPTIYTLWYTQVHPLMHILSVLRVLRGPLCAS